MASSSSFYLCKSKFLWHAKNCQITCNQISRAMESRLRFHTTSQRKYELPSMLLPRQLATCPPQRELCRSIGRCITNWNCNDGSVFPFRPSAFFLDASLPRHLQVQIVSRSFSRSLSSPFPFFIMHFLCLPKMQWSLPKLVLVLFLALS